MSRGRSRRGGKRSIVSGPNSFDSSTCCPLHTMGKNRILAAPCLFLLGLLLLPGGTPTSTTEPQYLVLVPVVVRVETTNKICVQLSHLNESVSLSITLTYGLQNRSLLSEEVSKKDLFKCASFQIPKLEPPISTHSALIIVEIRGPTLRYLSQKRVYVKDLENLIFVQTDKPIYKPGQEIHFRVACLDEDFRPVNEKIPMVYIQDPKRNRLFQWQEVQLNVGLAQLDFLLASEPALGIYKVVVQTASKRNLEFSFEVNEYVLPKFAVEVKVPKVLTILDNNVHVTVCAKYTFGKAVAGQVDVRVCRRYSYFGSSCYGEESKAVCEEFGGEADVHGCFSHMMDLKIFQMKREGFQKQLRVEGVITEEGTGVAMTGSATIEITSTLSTVTFEKMDTLYWPGLPYSGEMKLVDGSRKPMANKTIELQVSEVQNKFYYQTDAEGRVRFSINTSNLVNDAISLTATYEKETYCYDNNWAFPRHQSGHFSASRFYSPSESYLKIEAISRRLSCGEHLVVPVHYVLNPDVVQDKEVVFHYLVVVKGEIVKTGSHTLHGKKDKGTFNLELKMDKMPAPLVRLLMYTILGNGELVAHSSSFKADTCFLNKVQLRFAEREGLPGSNINLHLAAMGDSLCAVHAVDESVYLLKPGAELSSQSVYNLLPLKDLGGYYYGGENLEDPDVNPCMPPKKIVVDGMRYQTDVYSYGEGDAYTVFKNFGFKIFTSTKIHKPNICSPAMDRYPVAYSTSERMRGGLDSSPMALASTSAPEVVETLRTFFPETWLWMLKTLGGEGSSEAEVTMPVTIPDTITDWRAGAFCLSPSVGFGLAPATFLTAIQPFFIETTLPYSVVKGETFLLKVTIFNYLKQSVPVTISMLLSPDYDATLVQTEETTYCLPVDGRKTLSWKVVPKTLGEVNFTITAEALTSSQICGNEVVEVPTKGRRDIVVKTLLVEPEGIEKEVVINSLLCGDKDTKSTAISLKVPEHVVEKSARAHFCVLGDMLTSAIQNLQQLLQLPFGCGEQNMALFAPNVYVLDYLNNTGQLTDEVKSKAIRNLVAGYQRQLNYKHSDGSYSTFGEHNNQPGSIWLTAFVLKCFSQAKNQIPIEERHLTDALNFLGLKQKQNGCFQSPGTVPHNTIQGGVDDEISLSAYITVALLELPLPVTHIIMRNSLHCLETASQQKDIQVYTQILMVYAFTLAHKEDLRAGLLQSLQAKAVKGEEGSIHWERPVKAEEKPRHLYYQPRAPSAEVEMASYMLLAYVRKSPAPSQEDMTMATKIVSWLRKQQNPNGGFASTQDTVVALQALSLYGSLTFSKNTAGTEVALKSGENSLKQFHVDNTNSLVLQCHTLANVPGEYTAVLTGESCVYLQTTLKYNVHPQPEDSPFSLHVSTIPETCVGPKAHKEYDIAINISYIGARPASNMVIIDVKMASGFIPNKPSIRKLEKDKVIERADITASNVMLYLQKLTNVTQRITFTVERDIHIQNLKPAFVKVYDYYEDESTVVQYSAPCSTATHDNA